MFCTINVFVFFSTFCVCIFFTFTFTLLHNLIIYLFFHPCFYQFRSSAPSNFYFTLQFDYLFIYSFFLLFFAFFFIQIFSAANGGDGSCQLGRNSGTSMSCPIAAGAAALVRQYFVGGFYSDDLKARGGLCTTTSTWACDSFSPSGALVKVWCCVVLCSVV